MAITKSDVNLGTSCEANSGKMTSRKKEIFGLIKTKQTIGNKAFSMTTK